MDQGACNNPSDTKALFSFSFALVLETTIMMIFITKVLKSNIYCYNNIEEKLIQEIMDFLVTLSYGSPFLVESGLTLIRWKLVTKKEEEK